jgi:hypothetical protein
MWGREEIDELHRVHRTPRKWTIDELRALLAEYQAEVGEEVVP